MTPIDPRSLPIHERLVDRFPDYCIKRVGDLIYVCDGERRVVKIETTSDGRYRVTANAHLNAGPDAIVGGGELVGSDDLEQRISLDLSSYSQRKHKTN